MPKRTGTGESLELSDMMRLIADHCDVLAARIHAVENEIGAQFPLTSPLEATAITQVQGLDYVHQALKDLGVLAIALSRVDSIGTLSQTTADTIRTSLRLSDTQMIVGTVPNTDASNEYRNTAGHFDVF